MAAYSILFVILSFQVKSQIQKASQPVLTSVSVAWQQFSDPPPIQAPQQITALFNGSRLVVYGFINNCKMVSNIYITVFQDKQLNNRLWCGINDL
jgi:hypothetical protein